MLAVHAAANSSSTKLSATGGVAQHGDRLMKADASLSRNVFISSTGGFYMLESSEE